MQSFPNAIDNSYGWTFAPWLQDAEKTEDLGAIYQIY